MTRLLIVADDLSGAAETAGAVAEATGATPDLFLGRADGDAPVIAVDTGSRAIAPAAAAGATLQAVRRRHPDALVYKKVDSLLRGNIAAEVAALSAAGYPMLAALAVPRVGRTVRDGVVHVDGAATGSVPAALGARSVVISADADFEAEVRTALAAGAIPVLDGSTDDDLQRTAEVVAGFERPPVVLAAGGLARPLARLLRIPDATGRYRRGADRVVVVVGTREQSAARQVDRLAVPHVVVGPDSPVPLDGGDVVITLDPAPTWDDRTLEAALRRVGEALSRLPGRTDLVLTGGDTARRVLDSLGVTALRVESELAPGAVLSTTASGAAVITRPGSFGDDEGLVRLHSHLKGDPS